MDRVPSIVAGRGALYVLAVVALVTALPASANVQFPTSPDANSCSSSAPCLEWDNTLSGAGLKGVSTKGNGVIGITKSARGGHAGIFAQDASTAGLNYGV